MTSLEEIERYLLRDVDDAEAERIEDALFADPQSTAPVAELLTLIDTARALHASETTLGLTTSAAAIDALEGRGKRVHRETLRDGERTDAVIGADVELLVARLELDLTGVRSVDLELLDADGSSRGLGTDDVEVDRFGGCVWIPCAPHVALAMGVTLFRLHAHREDGTVTGHEYLTTMTAA